MSLRKMAIRVVYVNSKSTSVYSEYLCLFVKTTGEADKTNSKLIILAGGGA